MSAPIRIVLEDEDEEGSGSPFPPLLCSSESLRSTTSQRVMFTEDEDEDGKESVTGSESDFDPDDCPDLFDSSVKKNKRKRPRNCDSNGESSDESVSLLLEEGADPPVLFRHAANPFEVPYLLELIMDYLPLDDWKSCRLVNKQWNKSSERKLKKVHLVMNSKERLSSFLKEKMWNFTDRSKLISFEFPIDTCMSSLSMSTFFVIQGPFLKSVVIPSNGWTALSLQNVTFNRLPLLEELTIVGDIPLQDESRFIDGLAEDSKLYHLKKIIVYITNAHEKATPMVHLERYFNAGANEWTKRLLTDILAVAPNLESIQGFANGKVHLPHRGSWFCRKLVQKTSRSQEEVGHSILRVNQFLAQKLFSRVHDCNPHIKNLDLLLRLNDKGMKKLQHKNYPLEYLDIQVRFLDKLNFYSLLKSLWKTLKFLRLKMDKQFSIDLKCNFFIHLQVIHLDDYSGDLHFLLHIPNLKKVALNKFDCTRLIRRNYQPVPVPFDSQSSVQQLIIENCRPCFHQGSLIKKLAIYFPNLKQFKMRPIRDAELWRIYDSMPKLKELSVFCDGISCTALTGIVEGDMEKILRPGYERVNFEQYEKLRRLQYIGDLKDLKSLELLGNCTNLMMSDMGGREFTPYVPGLWIMHGISSLKNLNNLVIQNASISILEVKELIRNMNLVRLELVNCLIDPSMETWIRKKTFGKPFEFVYKKRA